MSSHLDPITSAQAAVPDDSQTSVKNPPADSATNLKRPKISQDIVQGLRLLDIDLPEDLIHKIAATYIGLGPMERFAKETCNIEGRVTLPGSVDGVGSSSCEANAGSQRLE